MKLPLQSRFEADTAACPELLPPCICIMQVRTMIRKPSTAKETGSMKNLALVAVLLGSFRCLPLRRTNTSEREHNAHCPKHIAPVPVEKDKKVDQEKEADEAKAPPKPKPGRSSNRGAARQATDVIRNRRIRNGAAGR
jgi:hypothetical protein